MSFKPLNLILVFSAILFSSLSSQASWNPKAYAYGTKAFGQFPGPAGLSEYSRGTMAAVWGGGLREIKYGTDIKPDSAEASLPEFFGKKLKIYIRPAASGRSASDPVGKKIRAPLMVFIPGVFANADEAMAQGMMELFSNLGYHVLLIPNCWSRDYHEALPAQRTEYPNDEANAVLALTKAAIKNLGAEYVDGAYISGESLGALTAAVAYEKDSNSSSPLFTGGATLFWPPIKLTSSINALDSMITSTESIYESKCHSLLKKLKTKFRVWRGKFLTSPTKDEIECAPAVVAQYSFRKELIRLAEKILEVNKAKQKVAPANLTFEDFISHYADRYRSALKPSDAMGYLGYWLRATNPNQFKKIQILTSSDDFVNAGQSWSELSAGLKRDQLIILPWGGHIGPTNHSAFKKLIKYQFKR
jgi:predicted alpha/beta-fold hydrolase